MMQDFFRKLVESQEPLGAEFQHVLDANRWDLYQSGVPRRVCSKRARKLRKRGEYVWVDVNTRKFMWIRG